MNIACLATSKIPSRTANSIQVMKTCHALKQLGTNVRLWVPRMEIADWESLSSIYGLSERFEITRLRSLSILRRYDLSLRSILQAEQWHADLIYTWNLQAAVLGLLRKLPVILELHALPTGKFGPFLFKQFLKIPGRKRLLVITDALRRMLEEEYSIRLDGNWIQIAPNGVDLEYYQDLPTPQNARRKLSLPEKITAAYTGHFYSGRGMNNLLLLAREFPGVNFLWVGGNPGEIATWKNRIAEEGLENILLTGFVPQEKLPLYQAAADILLMPYERLIAGSSGGNSADYCSPMKMFDYMAAGRAIITSDLPVIKEVLNPVNARICLAEDPESWILAFSELLDDSGKRIMLGAQARKDVLQYSWRTRAQKALQDFL